MYALLPFVLWFVGYLFFCFYFVAGNDEADIRTKHLLQFLHPALNLFQTVMKLAIELTRNFDPAKNTPTALYHT